MNTDGEEPLYKAESQQMVGAAMEVLNEIGHGFHEKPYENALVIGFRLRGITCLQQKLFDILYKNEKVGDYIPDLIAFDKIVVDTKVIEKITDREVGRATGSPLFPASSQSGHWCITPWLGDPAPD